MTKPAAVCSSLRCGHALAEPADRCPACGRPTWSARRVAVLGCLMLGLGLLLAATLVLVAAIVFTAWRTVAMLKA